MYSSKKGFFQVIIFYLVGLSIFFILGFLIVFFQVSHEKKIKTPQLIGKLYLDEHNNLLKKGLKVILEYQHSTNYPYGYILFQSIPAGKIIKKNEKLLLHVNISDTIINTPNLIGNHESFAIKSLNNLYKAEKKFILRLGIKTSIASKKPEGEILAQFPLPGTPVFPNYPVSILVSSNKAQYVKNIQESFNKQNIEIVKNISHEMIKPLKLVTKKTSDFSKDATVYSTKDSKNKILIHILKYRSQKQEENFPFKYKWVSLRSLDLDNGTYTLAYFNPKNEQFMNFAYLQLNAKSVIPIFNLHEYELFIWNDYLPRNQVTKKPLKKLIIQNI